jgi:putative endonuclease
LRQRIEDHNAGKGAIYTRSRRPVELIYQEEFTDLNKVMKREKQIKRWSRAKKESLVAENLDQLKYLSRRINGAD